jgi:predicted DCC family thiol-disulfide oxidoreductase YuxK
MRSTAFDKIFAALGPLGDRPAIVYDDECPFCSAYVRLFRLREAIGQVKLIAARERPDLVEAFREAGVSLNDGTAVIHRGEIYWGDKAINWLALMSSSSGIFNRLNGWIFASPRLSRLLYPVLRTGRNLTLAALGRSRLG